MKQQRIKILNVGFPKVGSTWIGRVLSNALNARLVEYDKFGNIRPGSTIDDVLLRICGKIPGRDKTIVEQVEKTHLLPQPGKFAWKDRDPDLITKIVYLCRDPRDMAVSYFYYTFHHRPYAEKGHVRKCSYLERKWFLFKSIARYYIHEGLWAPYVHACISYEDMWNDSYRACVTLLNTLNVAFDDEQLRESIHYHSWENSAKGRKAGEALNTSFLRSGVTGSHKNEYDPLDHLLAQLASILTKGFLTIRRAYLAIKNR